MLSEFISHLSEWDLLDSWIAITGALAAMSCALPGAWLLLRRQSLLGDALSHSILPGIVLAYLAMHWLEVRSLVARDSGSRHLILFAGAAVSGVFSAILTELLQRWGRLDQGAAIGVVFTTMFAFGLLLIRLFADKTHVDPSCVLYGSLETSALVSISKTIPIPQAAIVNGAILALNGLLIILFFKEMRISTFDPGLAESMGLNTQAIQLALMAMTAATLVAAFESVGAILVIAMLIVPAATARLLTDGLARMLLLSLIVAGASAALGHLAALTLPSILFARLGYYDVRGASSTGMMALAAGFLFVSAMICGPRHGLLRRLADQIRLRVRIASEDILGAMYRLDEAKADNNIQHADSTSTEAAGSWITWLARKRLCQNQLITVSSGEAKLTDHGREFAKNLVRSHRLWEAYMARHFVLPGDHLHSTAEQVEHFLSPELQTELAAELNQPSVDPHGKSIPN